MTDALGERKIHALEELPDGVLAAATTTLMRDRFDIQPGTVVRDSILRARTVIVQPGGTLELGTPDALYLLLWADRLVFQDGATPSSFMVPTPAAVHGSNGANGKAGAKGQKAKKGKQNGGDGSGGGPGDPGQAGVPGKPLPPMVFVVGEVRFQVQPASGRGRVRITAAGAVGGNGGNGGRGGAGGAGANGNPGSSETEPPSRF